MALSRCNTSKARLSHVGYRDCSIDSSKAMDHVAILHTREGFELQRGQNVSSYSSKRTTEYIDKDKSRAVSGAHQGKQRVLFITTVQT